MKKIWLIRNGRGIRDDFFRCKFTTEFQLREMPHVVWERKRTDFFRKIEFAQKEVGDEGSLQESIVLDKAVSPETRKTINIDSCILLVYAAESDHGQYSKLRFGG